MSKITKCNHDPNVTVCTECHLINQVAELEAKLDAVRAYINSSCDAVAGSFLIGLDQCCKCAGSRAVGHVFKDINAALQGEGHE